MTIGKPAYLWTAGNIQSVIEMATAIGEDSTAASLKTTLAKLTAQFNDEWLHPNGTYGTHDSICSAKLDALLRGNVGVC